MKTVLNKPTAGMTSFLKSYSISCRVAKNFKENIHDISKQNCI